MKLRDCHGCTIRRTRHHVNTNKSVLCPTQQLEFLNLQVNSVSNDIIYQSTGFPTIVSCTAYFRGEFASQSLSREAADLLLSSWRTQSNKNYDSYLDMHAGARGSDPIAGRVSEVANFLGRLSVQDFCSAISSVHARVDEYEVIILWLQKGAFRL